MPRKQRKTAEAQFWVTLNCDCPHCNAFLDLWKIVAHEDLPDAATSEETDILVNCPECEEVFTVTQVTY